MAIVLAGSLSYLLRVLQVSVQTITVFPETESGVTLNALLVIALMAGTASLMYILIRRRLKFLVKYLLVASFLFVATFLSFWYTSLIAEFLPPVLFADERFLLALSVGLGVSILFGVYRTRGAWQMVSVSTLGGLTGTFLGSSIPTLTAIVLLVALVAYDFFAVYKGPVGKIARLNEFEELTGAVFTVGDLTVGMGDIVFYSMLASNAMVNFGPVPFGFASAGLMVGAFLGFKMLERREMFPGLPFALVLGLGLMFLGTFAEPLIRIP